ncbi:MAG: hypothetical protein JW984_08085 [Deltaproteobacteria bacterium]|uniref:Uncharacterized protein n=1 Tax=Candidatus Zymogenus saltonus TaxID=2844893 RepID=A0A9D8PNE9_9DELT|nr:hypothetical protein [Candidatus Zymogenus saltonus]
MKSIKRGFILPVLLLVPIVIVSCGGEKKVSPTGDTTDKVKKGGVFADIVAALSEDASKPPDLAFEKGEMTKKEWKLFIRARNRLYVPIETYDYYYSEDESGEESEGEEKVDSLDDILKTEREQYLTLRQSLGDTPKSYDEVKKDVDQKLNDFFDDLTELMETVPAAEREKVLEIVCLRFSNTLLKQGVLPESFTAESH